MVSEKTNIHCATACFPQQLESTDFRPGISALFWVNLVSQKCIRLYGNRSGWLTFLASKFFMPQERAWILVVVVAVVVKEKGQWVCWREQDLTCDLEIVSQHMETEICGRIEKMMLIFVPGRWKQDWWGHCGGWAGILWSQRAWELNLPVWPSLWQGAVHSPGFRSLFVTSGTGVKMRLDNVRTC